MWKLKFEGVDKLYTEEEIQYWDNVPPKPPIEEISFRILGKKYRINGGTRYCIAKIGVSPFGQVPRHVGYVIYAIYGQEVRETRITMLGIEQPRKYDVSELETPLDRFRKGIGNGTT